MRICLFCGFRAETMDFMALRHINNGVFEDAVDNRQRVERDFRALRALK